MIGKEAGTLSQSFIIQVSSGLPLKNARSNAVCFRCFFVPQNDDKPNLDSMPNHEVWSVLENGTKCQVRLHTADCTGRLVGHALRCPVCILRSWVAALLIPSLVLDRINFNFPLSPGASSALCVSS